MQSSVLAGLSGIWTYHRMTSNYGLGCSTMADCVLERQTESPVTAQPRSLDSSVVPICYWSLGRFLGCPSLRLILRCWRSWSRVLVEDGGSCKEDRHQLGAMPGKPACTRIFAELLNIWTIPWNVSPIQGKGCFLVVISSWRWLRYWPRVLIDCRSHRVEG